MNIEQAREAMKNASVVCYSGGYYVIQALIERRKIKHDSDRGIYTTYGDVIQSAELISMKEGARYMINARISEIISFDEHVKLRRTSS